MAKTEKNHFIIYGLVPIKTANPQQLANGLENYDIVTEQTFIDGLVSGITFGIYNPTTVSIVK